VGGVGELRRRLEKLASRREEHAVYVHMEGEELPERIRKHPGPRTVITIRPPEEDGPLADRARDLKRRFGTN